MFGTKVNTKGMKWFVLNSSISKPHSRATVREQSSRGGISNASFNLNSGNDLNKVSSLLQKLKEVSSLKEQLASDNQSLKFKISELQKEKYSLSQLNIKLSAEVSKNRTQDQGVVILTKKDFNVFLKNYYDMAEELEQVNLMYSHVSQQAQVKAQLSDQYLQNALEAEEIMRQYKIT